MAYFIHALHTADRHAVHIHKLTYSCMHTHTYKPSSAVPSSSNGLWHFTCIYTYIHTYTHTHIMGYGVSHTDIYT
jgi:hypothetical protein